MLKACYLRIVFLSLPGFMQAVQSYAALSVSAGGGGTVCLGTSLTIGGSPTATGGTAPYTYSWAPSTYLSNITIANPTCLPSSNQTYTVFVTDAAGATGTSTVNVFMHGQSLASAGSAQAICLGDTITLGGPTNFTGGGTVFTWAPNIDISNTSAPNPLAWPVVTTTYTLTVTGPNCPTNTSTVNIVVHPLPVVSAGQNITILSGQSTQLNGTGAQNYFWSPSTSLNYPNIAGPDADPSYTITYNLIGTDQYGCAGYSQVTVTVVESDSLFIYNTFTPNGDGDNDNWYIGNIWGCPDNTLTVFNRYGRIVYTAHPYTNNWHGKLNGDELPAATYYFILDPGNGKKEVHGSVTILR